MVLSPVLAAILPWVPQAAHAGVGMDRARAAQLRRGAAAVDLVRVRAAFLLPSDAKLITYILPGCPRLAAVRRPPGRRSTPELAGGSLCRWRRPRDIRVCGGLLEFARRPHITVADTAGAALGQRLACCLRRRLAAGALRRRGRAPRLRACVPRGSWRPA